MNQHVVILMGGDAAERPISLQSGSACQRGLETAGYKVSTLDPIGKATQWIERLCRLNPDVVFNALHGPFGEDGKIQGVLEALGIPYTHSGPLASALAMDKIRSKILFARAGLSVAPDCQVTLDTLEKRDPLPRPYVVKPVQEGSSIGVVMVRPNETPDLRPLQGYRRLMAEQFIPGRELTVSCFDGKAGVVTELTPHQGFYDFDAKYTQGKTTHILPADLPPELYQKCLTHAEIAYATLGCRGVARVDFRFDPTAVEEQQLVVLELNTQPGMTDLSLVPEQAAYLGQNFPALVRQLVEDASCDR